MKKDFLTQTKNKNWWKFWALNMSLLNASMLCKNYIKFMKNAIGVGFENVIIVSRQGHATSFLIEEERKKFGEYLIRHYIKNNTVTEFCQVLNEKTKNMLAVMKELMKMKEINKNEFSNFLKQSYDYNSFYTVPRAIIDYTDETLTDQVIDELREARKYAEPIYTQIEDVTNKFATQIATEFNYSKEQILCMVIDEFEEYLKTGELPRKEVLEERFGACGIIFNKKEIALTLDPSEIEQLENINVKKNFNKKEIKGNIAFKGIAKGRVRIVHDPYKCKDFDEGNILITGMTRPEFLPLMRKSRAIVTDAGGLLCHAAIVARELAKPCIIGTQIATKVFKDGDMVEVDAEKGVIMLID